MKLCRGCATEKPEVGFYYGMNFCKPCHCKRTGDRVRERLGLPQERTLVKLNTKLKQPTDGTRICTKCLEQKPESEFSTNGVSRQGKVTVRSKCKKCSATVLRDFYHKNPKKKREYYLSHKFNMTPEQFDARLQEQGHECAACGCSDAVGNGWHIDHDHSCCPGEYSCGKCVRAILCMGCNNALGCIDDNAERLEKLIAYLRKFPKKSPENVQCPA